MGSVCKVMREFETDMKIAKLSPRTIGDRLELLARLARYLDETHGTVLIDATADQLRGFQSTVSHLAPASVNLYSRHIRALYAWALRRRLIAEDPAADLIVPRVPRARPHPTSTDDLRIVFACTKGPLRIAYVLASFAGLRRGEICRLQRADMDLDQAQPTALIHGKGGHERTVPLLSPVMDELTSFGLPRRGYVVTKERRPYAPDQMSLDSHHHLRALGLETTLHSMRATFATQAARVTRDPLFVRDLLGHRSVSTTERYMDSSGHDAHGRLNGVSTLAGELLSGRKLRAVQG